MPGRYGAQRGLIRSEVSYVSPMPVLAQAGRVGDMIAQLPNTLRELHSRCADGIYVRLLWSEHDGEVTVAVTDTKAGDQFTVEVRDCDRPLDVFHHPYAYVARTA